MIKANATKAKANTKLLLHLSPQSDVLKWNWHGWTWQHCQSGKAVAAVPAVAGAEVNVITDVADISGNKLGGMLTI